MSKRLEVSFLKQLKPGTGEETVGAFGSAIKTEAEFEDEEEFIGVLRGSGCPLMNF